MVKDGLFFICRSPSYIHLLILQYSASIHNSDDCARVVFLCIFPASSKIKQGRSFSSLDFELNILWLMIILELEITTKMATPA